MASAECAAAGGQAVKRGEKKKEKKDLLLIPQKNKQRENVCVLVCLSVCLFVCILNLLLLLLLLRGCRERGAGRCGPLLRLRATLLRRG